MSSDKTAFNHVHRVFVIATLRSEKTVITKTKHFAPRKSERLQQLTVNQSYSYFFISECS